MKCHGCGVEKDPSVKEGYEFPVDGVVDMESTYPPLLVLEVCGSDWRYAVVCHKCYHDLDPDMWISENCWIGISPVTPFDMLPKQPIELC